MDLASLPKTREWRNVTPATLRNEIIPLDRPAVLKGLVNDWPIVRASAQSRATLYDYVRTRDQGRPIKILVGQPDIQGVYFYRDDLSGLNFEYVRKSFHETLATIPNLWWHNVESLDPVNLSVNYWWVDGPLAGGEPFAALAHSLLAIKPLPPGRRAVWRQMFDHYVFENGGDPVPYLPRERRGMLGDMSPELQAHVRSQLIRSLTKQMPPALRDQILRLLWGTR